MKMNKTGFAASLFAASLACLLAIAPPADAKGGGGGGGRGGSSGQGGNTDPVRSRLVLPYNFLRQSFNSRLIKYPLYT